MRGDAFSWFLSSRNTGIEFVSISLHFQEPIQFVVKRFHGPDVLSRFCIETHRFYNRSFFQKFIGGLIPHPGIRVGELIPKVGHVSSDPFFSGDLFSVFYIDSLFNSWYISAAFRMELPPPIKRNMEANISSRIQ